MAAVALLAAAAPAHGVERWSGTHGSYTLDDHARVCFVGTFPGMWTAVATGVGAVTTTDTFAELATTRKGRPADRFSDATAASRGGGDMSLCVGGVEGTVVSGSAVYTLVAEHTSGEWVVVLQCTFSRSGPFCR